jgi:hypothetical protein
MWFCVAVVEFVFGVLESRVTESEPTVNRCEDASLKRVTVHLTEDAALLDVGSSNFDLSVVRLPCKVLWCSTVLK